MAANEIASGTAKLVFRDLAFLGPESIDAALAGYAAAQQGRFWDMWATVYANQGHENSGAFSRDRLVAMASALGLDATRFVADMDSSAARSHLDAASTAAGAAGISSTPTIVINGRLMTGASYPEIAAAIAAAR